MTKARLRDLTDEQNERARDIARKIMRERDWTAKDLGDAVGLHKGAVSGFLGGRQGTSHAVVHRLADLARVDVAEILTGESTPAERLTIDPTDQYPGRARAIAAARALGWDDDAIERVRGRTAEYGGADAAPEFWFALIFAEMRRGPAPPAREALHADEDALPARPQADAWRVKALPPSIATSTPAQRKGPRR